MKKLLIIEDSPDFTFIYRDFLKEYSLTFALERAEIEAAIDQVDLVICDYHFSETLSFEQVLELVGGRKPVILCSGEFGKVAQYGGCDKIDVQKKLKGMISDRLGAISDQDNSGAFVKSIG